MYLFMCVLQWISIYEIHFGSRGYSFEITCNFLSPPTLTILSCCLLVFLLLSKKKTQKTYGGGTEKHNDFRIIRRLDSESFHGTSQCICVIKCEHFRCIRFGIITLGSCTASLRFHFVSAFCTSIALRCILHTHRLSMRLGVWSFPKGGLNRPSQISSCCFKKIQ